MSFDFEKTLEKLVSSSFVEPGKNPKLINVRPTLIPESRVDHLFLNTF